MMYVLLLDFNVLWDFDFLFDFTLEKTFDSLDLRNFNNFFLDIFPCNILDTFLDLWNFNISLDGIELWNLPLDNFFFVRNLWNFNYLLYNLSDWLLLDTFVDSFDIFRYNLRSLGCS